MDCLGAGVRLGGHVVDGRLYGKFNNVRSLRSMKIVIDAMHSGLGWVDMRCDVQHLVLVQREIPNNILYQVVYRFTFACA